MLGHTTTAYVKLMVALNLSLGVCIAFMFTKLALPLVLYAQTDYYVQLSPALGLRV